MMKVQQLRYNLGVSKIYFYLWPCPYYRVFWIEAIAGIYSLFNLKIVIREPLVMRCWEMVN